MSMFDALTDGLGITNSTKKRDEEADRLRQQAGDMFKDVKAPDLQNITPEQYKWLQDYQPELLGELQKSEYSDINSEFDNVSSDPRLKDAQMSALRSMQDIANNGGMNAEDKANLARIQSEASQADRGRREAIMQNMQARGMGGAGAELLAQLQSSQAATDRQAQQGLDVAGMAQRRALEAMMNQGNMAGNIRGQDFGEASQKASAADAIAKFNASNSLANQQFNIGNDINKQQTNMQAINQGNQFNIQGKQGVASANVDNTNKAQVQNNDVKQQGFGNDMTIKGAQSGALQNQAQAIDTRTGQKSAKDSQMFGTLAQAGAAAYASDKRVKKDIKEVNLDDITEFLAAVKPKAFTYKGSNDPKLGLMAQDVENTRLGDKVVKEDDNGMKMIDQQSLNGVMLAAIKALAEGKK